MKPGSKALISRIKQYFEKDIFKFLGPTLQDWRNSIFTIIFTIVIIFGSINLVSSVNLALDTGYWLNVVLYIAVYGILLIMLTITRIPYKVRAVISCLLFYLLGTLAFFTFGPLSSAKLYLLTFSILLTLLLGIKFGLLGLIMNYGIFFYVSWLFKQGMISWPYLLSDYTYSVWMTTGITFLFQNLVITIASGMLVHGTEKIIRANETYVDELTSKNAELYLAIEKQKLTQQQLKTALSQKRLDHSA